MIFSSSSKKILFLKMLTKKIKSPFHCLDIWAIQIILTTSPGKGWVCTDLNISTHKSHKKTYHGRIALAGIIPLAVILFTENNGHLLK